MRFALMEAKACLVSILRKYRFERSPDTQVILHIKNTYICIHNFTFVDTIKEETRSYSVSKRWYFSKNHQGLTVILNWILKLVYFQGVYKHNIFKNF